MPDITMMSNPEKLKYMSFLFDSNLALLYKAYGNSAPGKFKALSLLSSPSTNFIGNVLDIGSNAFTGAMTADKKSWKHAAKSAKEAAKGVAPSTTLPFISPFLNQLLGDKSYHEAGQKQIYGK